MAVVRCEREKQKKYQIMLDTNEPFAFAGLWSEWNDVNTGQMLTTYTILTTAANELMSEIHNSQKRMPIILAKEDEEKWLDEGKVDATELKLKAI